MVVPAKILELVKRFSDNADDYRAPRYKDDADPAFQPRRYAWSARLPLSILTNLRDFVVRDFRVKRAKTEKSSAESTGQLICGARKSQFQIRRS